MFEKFCNSCYFASREPRTEVFCLQVFVREQTQNSRTYLFLNSDSITTSIEQKYKNS